MCSCEPQGVSAQEIVPPDTDVQQIHADAPLEQTSLRLTDEDHSQVLDVVRSRFKTWADNRRELD